MRNTYCSASWYYISNLFYQRTLSYTLVVYTTTLLWVAIIFSVLFQIHFCHISFHHITILLYLASDILPDLIMHNKFISTMLYWVNHQNVNCQQQSAEKEDNPPRHCQSILLIVLADWQIQNERHDLESISAITGTTLSILSSDWMLLFRSFPRQWVYPSLFFFVLILC